MRSKVSSQSNTRGLVVQAVELERRKKNRNDEPAAIPKLEKCGFQLILPQRSSESWRRES
jgi:hypothetical protein